MWHIVGDVFRKIAEVVIYVNFSIFVIWVNNMRGYLGEEKVSEAVCTQDDSSDQTFSLGIVFPAANERHEVH